ncbi:C-type lectin 37Da [Drosophila yakuba]|uniref:C-type lectin domain-containing protein n=1 Tax=Drosophila yakuba TaxID=7245 RepID=B4PAX9_DROYA|nr:C-type lectin 37Da [Drosophila yakuba]EDW90408.1 uncharacterized protein Dyak_GE13248 [Drosophila yakuba]
MPKTLVRLLLIVACFAPGLTFDKYTTHIQNGNPNNLTVDMTPFVKINGSYYVFGQSKVNWHLAYEDCRRLGSELVAFETSEEFDDIAAHLNARGDRSEHWTSGNDLARTGDYYWFSNVQLVTIKRWAPNQPDNSGGNEHCIHMGYIYGHSTEFQLNDRPCNGDPNSLFKYICEAPKQETISIVVWK